jgi:hypothetical protein
MALFDFLNPLNAITDSIVKWQTVKETAKNDKTRIEAEVKIKELESSGAHVLLSGGWSLFYYSSCLFGIQYLG